jgi:L-lactate dehydrogenase complex protein LldG
MAIQDDILSILTQNKDKIPFDFNRKENIKNELNDIKSFYSDKQEENQDIIELFKDRFEALTGKFYKFSSNKELANLLQTVLGKDQTFFSYNNEILKFLESENFKLAKDVTQATVSLTFCDFVIARTGTIMISSHSAKGRKVISYPDIHIIIATKDQVVFDISDAINSFYEKHQDKFPSFVSFITGPSKTADIEKTLILGAHGPKKIFLFLSENKTLLL